LLKKEEQNSKTKSYPRPLLNQTLINMQLSKKKILNKKLMIAFLGLSYGKDLDSQRTKLLKRSSILFLGSKKELKIKKQMPFLMIKIGK